MTAAKPLKKAKAKPVKSNNKKLTLSLNPELIAQGKFFAKTKGMSLSALAEQFLRDKIKEETFVPVTIIKPDAEIGALFLVSPHFSGANKSMYQLRDEYYTAVLNREQIEEE